MRKISVFAVFRQYNEVQWQVKFITETDIEKMLILAEDVADKLDMRYMFYDEEGREEVDNAVQRFMKDPNAELFHKLYREHLSERDSSNLTAEDIRKKIEPNVHKALGLFRNGTGTLGRCDYAAAKTVSDEYLLNLLACEVRDKMRIFDAQRFSDACKIKGYLLVEKCNENEKPICIKFFLADIREKYKEYLADEDSKELLVYCFETIKNDHRQKRTLLDISDLGL